MASKMCWQVLSILRICWCLLPQTGYLHPDEFFQSPEVMAGTILDLNVYHPWEFLPKSPCRTIVFPLVTSGAAFWVIKALHHLDLWRSSINSYTLLVSPRLLFTLFSFILDYSVYQLAPLWGADAWTALALLAGSYVTLVFYTRTFTNTVEGLLFALLLLLVSLTPRSKTLTSSMASKQIHPLHHSFIGIVTVAGFFNRPTFLAFALVPLLHWASVDLTSQQSVRRSVTCLLQLVPSASLTAVVFIVADTWYFASVHLELNLHGIYKDGPLTFLRRMCQSIVVTPFNFLSYNLNPDNLAQHGTHPHVTHFAVNGALLFGILHLEAIRSGFRLLKGCIDHFACLRALKRKSHSVAACPEGRPALLMFYFVPLACLSLFSHQEPRFLIPLVLPLVILAAQRRQTQRWTLVNVVFNVCGALFFGCIHQGGVVPCLLHLERLTRSAEALSQPTHHMLLFAHTYMPPRFLLNIHKGSTLVEVVDVGGTEGSALCRALASAADGPACAGRGTSGGDCRVLVIIPGTARSALERCRLPLRSETAFFPHLTLEDPPRVSLLLSAQWRTQLALHVLRLERGRGRAQPGGPGRRSCRRGPRSLRRPRPPPPGR
ncbi:GPI mannosyltransferase 4 [Tiliqua scincoides]|uniref:GPI mannosyltransferase 4 n=1 Tax=Tiliqua scincoides TaxID=71010 RepID=UPI003461D91B